MKLLARNIRHRCPWCEKVRLTALSAGIAERYTECKCGNRYLVTRQMDKPELWRFK